MVPEIKDFEQRKEALIKKGKELGFITYEELAEELKGLDVNSDLLDELYNDFIENDISVIVESNFDSDYKIIKPEDNYDNNNEYKEEYLRLLKENIFHICYKDENGKYFKVNDKEKEEKKYDLSIIDEKKEEKQSYSLKYTIIITIIIVLSTILWKTLIN